MDTSTSAPEQMHEPVKTVAGHSKDRFFPSGAIAFFVALVILCLIIWFGIYFLMLERI